MTEFVARPQLSSYGIEEVEANVCEDTFENRQKLTSSKIPFKIFEPGLIEVLWQDVAELNKHHSNMLDKYRSLLVDPRDPWSDYQAFNELPLDYMESAPAWIQRHLNKFNDSIDAGEPEHKRPLLPTRCRRRRADGSRCWGWSWPAATCDGFCKQHAGKFAFDSVGQLAQVRDAARMRIAQLTPHAVEALEDLMLNSTVPHVRLKAATELLDRDGIRGGSELTVSGTVTHELDPATAVREKLSILAERLAPKELPEAEDVVEAEIISESETDAQPTEVVGGEK